MFTFRFGKGNAEIVVSHKELEQLKKNSAWLAALIKYDGSKDEIFLLDTCPTYFDKLLKLSINNDAESRSASNEPEELLSLLHISHMLNFKNVEDKCCYFLLKNISLNNYLAIFNNIAMLDLRNSLEQEVYFIVKWNLPQILNQEEFLDWNFHTWFKILKCDNIPVSEEISLFMALIKWQQDNKIRGFYLDKLIELVRFPLITRNDFESVVVPSGLLNSKQITEMREFYTDSTKNTGFNSIPREFQLGVNDGVEF